MPQLEQFQLVNQIKFNDTKITSHFQFDFNMPYVFFYK